MLYYPKRSNMPKEGLPLSYYEALGEAKEMKETIESPSKESYEKVSGEIDVHKQRLARLVKEGNVNELENSPETRAWIIQKFNLVKDDEAPEDELLFIEQNLPKIRLINFWERNYANKKLMSAKDYQEFGQYTEGFINHLLGQSARTNEVDAKTLKSVYRKDIPYFSELVIARLLNEQLKDKNITVDITTARDEYPSIKQESSLISGDAGLHRELSKMYKRGGDIKVSIEGLDLSVIYDLSIGTNPKVWSRKANKTGLNQEMVPVIGLLPFGPLFKGELTGAGLPYWQGSRRDQKYRFRKACIEQLQTIAETGNLDLGRMDEKTKAQVMEAFVINSRRGLRMILEMGDLDEQLRAVMLLKHREEGSELTDEDIINEVKVSKKELKKNISIYLKCISGKIE